MSTDNDFVARLRIRWDAMGDMANDERAAAADEIERLRNTRDALEAERDELIRIANKLTRERDEARQRVCSIAYQEQHIQKLAKTINTLLIERDEARRYACDNNPFRLTKWQLAKIKGWDCFDLENGNA